MNRSLLRDVMGAILQEKRKGRSYLWTRYFLSNSLLRCPLFWDVHKGEATLLGQHSCRKASCKLVRVSQIGLLWFAVPLKASYVTWFGTYISVANLYAPDVFNYAVYGIFILLLFTAGHLRFWDFWLRVCCTWLMNHCDLLSVHHPESVLTFSQKAPKELWSGSGSG